MRLHTTDRLSLGFGLFFLAVASFWLVVEMASLNATTLAWSTVGGLFLCGLLGLAGVAASARRRRGDDHHP